MRRWLTIATAALIIGAVANVLVAWCCLVFSAESRRAVIVEPWPVGVPKDWPAFDQEQSVCRGIGYERRHIAGIYPIKEWFKDAEPDPDKTATEYEMTYEISGVPFKCLYGCGLRKRRYSVDYFAWPPISGGLAVPQFLHSSARPWLSGRSARRLPVRAHGWQFAANTGCYAGVLALGWVGFGGVRHGWRTARGRCARCGYTVAGLEICPECGRKRVKRAGWKPAPP